MCLKNPKKQKKKIFDNCEEENTKQGEAGKKSQLKRKEMVQSPE